MEINLAQATLHFLTKSQNITGEEAEIFVAVKNHWKQEVEKAAQSMTEDDEQEDAA